VDIVCAALRTLQMDSDVPRCCPCYRGRLRYTRGHGVCWNQLMDETRAKRIHVSKVILHHAPPGTTLPDMSSGRSIIKRAIRRIVHPSGGVIRQGEFVTFQPRGFVEASDPAALLCRHYYEVKHLSASLGLMSKYGVTPQSSLEIGCGYGRLSPYIATHVERHTAVDINSWAVDQARQYYPNVSFAIASATDLPFPDDGFDVVITWTVLQHIPDSHIEKALTEISRVAKRKSLLILCEATLNAGKPERPGQHTHDRFPDFYANAFARPLLVSEFIQELDQFPSIQSPGRMMVFGPGGAE